jgi:DNA-binding LacI/PurR family transcriptional regulator
MNKITDVVISHLSVVSLHAQLHSQLSQLILSGRWAHGSRIPSETEFSRHLNVSRTTVRLALQQAEIEGLIERTAGRGTFVAYQPTETSERRLIAFVTYGFDAESHLFMLMGAEKEAKTRGYQIVLNYVQSYQEEIESLQRLRREQADGILLWAHSNASHSEQQTTLNYQGIRLPMVLMDRQVYGIDCDCVTSDNYGGAKALMEHLIELGHRHIVFLSHHEMSLNPVSERYRAYRDTMQDAGLLPSAPWLIGQQDQEINMAQAVRSAVDARSPELLQIKEYMLNAAPRPTAIFAVNDSVAIIASWAMKLLDLRVPDAVSIAGFDDVDMAAHLEVPLTTVAQDFFAVGKRAMQLLVDRMDGYAGPTCCEVLPTQLRIRHSTGMPLRVSP